jgi:hypothetical protein
MTPGGDTSSGTDPWQLSEPLSDLALAYPRGWTNKREHNKIW